MDDEARQLRILVVDDDEDQFASIGALLQGIFGAHLDAYEPFPEKIPARAGEVIEDERKDWDLVLLDVPLPV